MKLHRVQQFIGNDDITVNMVSVANLSNIYMAWSQLRHCDNWLLQRCKEIDFDTQISWININIII